MSGQQINTGQGTLTYTANEVQQALSGQQVAEAQGAFGRGTFVPMRSRRIGQGSSASAALTGVVAASAIGALGKQRTRALSGSAMTSATGAVAAANADATWTATVPPINFTQGVAATSDLLQYTANFNSVLHDMVLATGSAALPSGITLSVGGTLTYNGVGPVASSSLVIFEIRDEAVLTPEADFATRRSGPGVIRSFDFNSSAQLGGGFGANFGNLTQGSDPAPVIDTLVKASGASSMRFDHGPVLGGSLWWTNLSTDLSTLYGAGDVVFFQFRYRVSSEIAADYAAKIFLFGTGDTPGVFQSSCTDLEVELNSQIFGQKFLMAYNACPGSCGANSVFTFEQAMVGGQRFLTPNQWMTVQCGITLGPLEQHAGHDWFAGSNVKIWIQYDIGPEILVFNWTGGVTPGSTPTSNPPCWGLCAGQTVGSGQKYGKLWLLPYNQELDSGALPGKIWYDDLIISTQKIPAVLA